jgi:hypothetical protein
MSVCRGAQAASLHVSAACRDREIHATAELRALGGCRQGYRQLQAGSLCSPERCIAREVVRPRYSDA